MQYCLQFVPDRARHAGNDTGKPADKEGDARYWDLASWGPQNEPEWGAIKMFANDGIYDYEHALSQNNHPVSMLASLTRSITKPSYNADRSSDLFRYWLQHRYVRLGQPLAKRPWPGYSGWGSLSAPIKINGEQLMWNGSQNVWVPFSEVTISLTRVMMQQVAALLGVTEYCVIDGADIRWFVPNPTTGAWHNVL